ncbi:enterotoxin type A [Leptotrichia buccalis]
MFNEYLENQRKETNYLKSIAENLQLLNKELKEDNDKYDEKQMNEMYEYYENGGLVNEY